jgi:hypothetical protein
MHRIRSIGSPYDISDLADSRSSANLLTADMLAAEDRLSMLAQHAKGGYDITVVTRLRPTLYTALARSDRGVEACLEYLRRGGTVWWLDPTRDEVRHEYGRIWSVVRSRQIEGLVHSALINNPSAGTRPA